MKLRMQELSVQSEHVAHIMGPKAGVTDLIVFDVILVRDCADLWPPVEWNEWALHFFSYHLSPRPSEGWPVTLSSKAKCDSWMNTEACKGAV